MDFLLLVGYFLVTDIGYTLQRFTGQEEVNLQQKNEVYVRINGESSHSSVPFSYHKLLDDNSNFRTFRRSFFIERCERGTC